MFTAVRENSGMEMKRGLARLSQGGSGGGVWRLAGFLIPALLLKENQLGPHTAQKAVRLMRSEALSNTYQGAVF